MKKKYKVISMMIGLALLCAGCGADTSTENPTPSSSPQGEQEQQSIESPQETVGEPTVIKWGHNWIPEIDPNYLDPVTGESPLGAEELSARLYAEQQVLEKYNVKIEYVQYPSSVEEIILQTVLAGDPVADIVRLYNGSQGQVLAQNVLQPLDDYAYLFEDEDNKWMFWGETYGHNYFLNNVMRFGSNDLLCYNIGMINKVEALKVDGKTKYPADYFVEGNWTWSVFEDYLQKVNDYFKQEWEGNHAYQTDYRAATLDAIYSNGGEIYGDKGFGADSDNVKEAVEFIDRLITKGLIYSENQNNNSADIDGLMDTWRFQWGHTVFVNLPQWLSGDMVSHFAERGDAMGVVPFPRPDSMAFDDPNYRQLNDATDCYAIPRGLSPERTELAIKVFIEYTQSYYKKLAGSDKAMDYMRSEKGIRNEAIRLNLDVTNQDYGENILKSFAYLVEGDNAYVNDYSKNAGLYNLWSRDILGYSYYGLEGSPKYSVQIEAKKNQLTAIMNNYEAVLGSSEIKDNISPQFASVEGMKFAFPAGTSPESVDWAGFMTASDNIDGEISMANAVVDYSGVDFNAIGVYDGGLHYSIKDASGNEGTDSRTVIIYDGENTTAPELILKPVEEYRQIQLEENASQINWKDDFVVSAVDKDGLDIRDSIQADLSELDTTTPGEYEVVLTVTDYAGNQKQEAIVVTVVK